MKRIGNYNSRLIRHDDGNLYEAVIIAEGTDSYIRHVVLKGIGSDRRVLRLPPPGDHDLAFYVDGIDLDEVNESVREIVLEDRQDFVGENNTLPSNFIRDITKLPNLREIRAITRNSKGECLTNVWIKGWDEREVPYLIHHDGLCYRILDDKKHTVRTCSGGLYSGAYVIDGNLKLPEKIIYKGQEYTLEHIAYRSFLDTRIKSVSIPPSVKAIYNGAFWNCSELEKVELSEGLKELDDFAFSGCMNLKELRLPDSLVSIGEYAIDCQHLILGASLREIKYEGCNCDILTLPAKHAPEQIKLLDHICAREYRLDGDCETLTVHDGAIYDKDMKTLLAYPKIPQNKVVTLPFSVTKIDKNAFGHGLPEMEIRIPTSVRKIPDTLKHPWIKVTRIKRT